MFPTAEMVMVAAEVALVPATVAASARVGVCWTEAAPFDAEGIFWALTHSAASKPITKRFVTIFIEVLLELELPTPALRATSFAQPALPSGLRSAPPAPRPCRCEPSRTPRRETALPSPPCLRRSQRDSRPKPPASLRFPRHRPG